jgi:predicted nucleotidyltransferase
VNVYVFGSSVTSKVFNDVDVLFLIPNDVLSKVEIYDAIQGLCNSLNRELGCVIDFTILTRTEDMQIQFINKAKAVFVGMICIDDLLSA